MPHLDQKTTEVNIKYNGDIMWYPHFEYSLPVTYKLDEQPFDTQEINVVLGSWSKTYDELKYVFANNDKNVDIKQLNIPSDQRLLNFTSSLNITEWPSGMYAEIH